MRNQWIADILLGLGLVGLVLYAIHFVWLIRQPDKARKRIVILFNIWGLILFIIYGFSHNILVNPIYLNAFLHLDFSDPDSKSFLVIWLWRALVYYPIFSILVWKMLKNQKLKDDPKLLYRYFFLFSFFISTAWTTDFEKFLFVNHGVDIYFFLHWIGGLCASFMFYMMEIVYLEKSITEYLGIHGNHFNIRKRIILINIGLVLTLVLACFGILIGGIGKDSPNLMMIKMSIIVASYLVPFVLIIVKNANNIAENVEKTVAFLSSAARQDFSLDASIRSLDDFSELGESLESLKSSFRDVIGAAKETASEVFNSAEQIRASLDRLSVQIDSYCNELNEFTASQINTAGNAGISIEDTSSKFATVMEVIDQQSEVVRENSRIIETVTGDLRGISAKTRDASQTTDALYQAADEGGKLIDETLQSIEAIETSSQRIGEITGIIDNIAEQTSLLAMNAAIEASHAGEAGKGFAIVAEEMRKLAENSAANTANITSLIEEIMSRVKDSLKLMTDSRQSFQNIHREVANTREVNLSIASSMENQTASLGQILSMTARLEEITAKIRETSEHFSESNRVMKITFGEISTIADNEKIATRKSSDLMIGSIESMNGIIANNLQVANKLKSIIGLFKLSGGDSQITPV